MHPPWQNPKYVPEFRLAKITSSSSKFDHTLSYLPERVCPALAGTDSKGIPSWGLVCRHLSFRLHTFFATYILATYILATVSQPILGLDFLANHHLLVDPVARLVLDAKTLQPIGKSPAGALPHSKFAASLCSIAPAVRSLLASFLAIVGDDKETPTPCHGVCHTVETKGRPVYC